WLGIEALLGTTVAGWERLVTDAESAARERFLSARDAFDAVFDAVAVPDLAVVRALMEGSFGRPGAARQQAIERVVTLYRDAFSRTSATPRQMDSAIGQLAFFASMLGTLAASRSRNAVAPTIAALEEIRSRVVGPPDPSAASDATLDAPPRRAR